MDELDTSPPVAQWLQLIRPVYERSRVRLASETYMSQIKYKKYVEVLNYYP